MLTWRFRLFILLGAVLLVPRAIAQSGALNEALWDAARAGDPAAVAKALDAGAEVNARSRYDVTALFYAAGSGHLAVVQLLLDRGANPNLVDTFYKGHALDMAVVNGHLDVGALLLEHRSVGAGDALMQGIREKHQRLVRAALAGSDVDPDTLARTPTIVNVDGREELVTNGTKIRGYDPPPGRSAGLSDRTRRSRSARRWPMTISCM